MEWQYANAQNMCEFAAGRNGPCLWLALLACLHVIRPDNWRMTPGDLDRLTRLGIAHGAAQNGAATPAEGTAVLDALGIRYSRLDPSGLRALLADPNERRPVVIEYAHAGRLPGDEPGVNYHYNARMGACTQVERYWFADGDYLTVRATRGLGPLDSYSWSDLDAAAPCAVIVIEEAPMITLDMPDVAKYFVDASVPGDARWQCRTNGHILRGGMLAAYRAAPSLGLLAGLYEWGLPLTDEIVVPGYPSGPGQPVPVCQRFEMGSRLYDPEGRVDPRPGAVHPAIYPAHVDQGIGRS